MYPTRNDDMVPCIPFLDLEILRYPSKCEARHYIKPSQTNRVIPYDSAHPKSMLTAVLKGEVNRSLNLCTREKDKKIEIQRITNKYVASGYPINLINKAFITASQPGSRPSLSYEKWVGLPYIPGLFEIAKSFLSKHNIGVYFASPTTIHKILTGPKNHSQGKTDQRGVV